MITGLSVGTRIRAKRKLVLSRTEISKGTQGHVSRISPRLKDSYVYENGLLPETVPVKFPGVRSFFCTRCEIEIL